MAFIKVKFYYFSFPPVRDCSGTRLSLLAVYAARDLTVINNRRGTK